jgi:energy-coupling factor transporter ATP-binding protein EcfA2
MIYVVGIHGKAFSGKTTVCNLLSDMFPSDWHITVCGLADPLKHECAEATGLPVAHFFSPDKALKDTLRPLMQWWGTEFKRNPVLGGYDAYWIDAMNKHIAKIVADNPDKKDFFVGIHDLRFDNEAEMVRNFNKMPNMHGKVLKLVGKNFGDTQHTNHASEAGIALPNIDAQIINDHVEGLDILRSKVKLFFDEHVAPILYP